jgi:DNA-binding NarL/FixJ family response regulator
MLEVTGPPETGGPTAGGATIRLLIVDDHEIVRQGLQLLFSMEDGIDVVGVAEDGGEAISRTAELHPDVVLMDVGMPRVDGVEATRRITAEHPASRVVILSGGDLARIQDALRAGASAYLFKHSAPDDVVRAVRGAYPSNPAA